MKKRDWKTFNCSKPNCKNKRYNKKLKLCINHYRRNKKDVKKIYNIDKRFKHEPKHYTDLKRFRIKYKSAREAILLVTWHEEYKKADLKDTKAFNSRRVYLLKIKYNRFTPDILNRFDEYKSCINKDVVHEYKHHIKELEAHDWRCRTVLPKGPHLHLRYHNKIKKKEKDEEI